MGVRVGRRRERVGGRNGGGKKTKFQVWSYRQLNDHPAGTLPHDRTGVCITIHRSTFHLPRDTTAASLPMDKPELAKRFRYLAIRRTLTRTSIAKPEVSCPEPWKIFFKQLTVSKKPINRQWPVPIFKFTTSRSSTWYPFNHLVIKRQAYPPGSIGCQKRSVCLGTDREETLYLQAVNRYSFGGGKDQKDGFDTHEHGKFAFPYDLHYFSYVLNCRLINDQI